MPYSANFIFVSSVFFVVPELSIQNTLIVLWHIHLRIHQPQFGLVHQSNHLWSVGHDWNAARSLLPRPVKHPLVVSNRKLKIFSILALVVVGQ